MAEKIKLTFLGTSDQIPSVSRNHTSILLSWQNENILIDCGEGTQRQLRKAKINPGKITRILITHWHADHVLGLPGLLHTLAASQYNKTLYIYGPRKIKNRIKDMKKTFDFFNDFPIEVKEVKRKFFENDDFYLEAFPLKHRTPCNAYNFVKKGKTKIDKQKLKDLGVESEPSLKELKKGKNIKINGKKLKAKEMTYKQEDKKISFVLDTRFDKKIISFVKNSDLLVCEATFSSELEDKAKEHYHLTSKQAGEIAKKSDSKKLILTHLSQRYEQDTKKILEEVKEVFDNSFVARDLDIFYLE